MGASRPLYQVLTHASHPKMLLQHLVTITGGLMGTAVQMAHLKVSLNFFFSDTGIFVSSVNDKTSSSFFLMILVSSTRLLRSVDC